VNGLEKKVLLVRWLIMDSARMTARTHNFGDFAPTARTLQRFALAKPFVETSVAEDNLSAVLRFEMAPSGA